MNKKTATILTFKPKQVTKRLLSTLPERAMDVLVKRYGLGKDPQKMTLEAIGEQYGITRERVRQIEGYALGNIRKSDVFGKESPSFDELAEKLTSLGGVILEEELLESVSKDKSVQNHIHFLLVLGEIFKSSKEGAEFGHRWFVDEDIAQKVQEALRKLYKSLSTEDLVSESKLIDMFLNEVKDINQEYKDEEIIKRWLSLSKKLGKNPLGEWGVSDSSNVKVKGIRDYAYLAIKQHGSPMHFNEVANSITQLFDRKAHKATCHNELIKDPRFVLVGRGLYALSEWGYTTGVVKDVIKEIIEKHGPLTKDEIIDKVLKERYVKNNTIVVNLQDPMHFKRNKEGQYLIV